MLLGNKLDIAEDNKEERKIRKEEAEKICNEQKIYWGGEHDKKRKAEDKAIHDKFVGIMQKRKEKFNNDKDKKEDKIVAKVSHDFWIEEIKSVNEVLKGGDDF